MTPKGMKQAAEAAVLTRSFLEKKNWTAPNFTFITSAHFRTLQTAASFQYEFTKSAETEILLNESIVLKNGTSDWKRADNKCPFRNGALAKFSSDVLFK